MYMSMCNVYVFWIHIQNNEYVLWMHIFLILKYMSILDLAVSRIIPPSQNVHLLIPKTCEYVTFHPCMAKETSQMWLRLRTLGLGRFSCIIQAGPV